MRSTSPLGVPDVYLSLATTMSKVQITLTRTNPVKPIRIHVMRASISLFGCVRVS
jgi:hypothetical protein